MKAPTDINGILEQTRTVDSMINQIDIEDADMKARYRMTGELAKKPEDKKEDAKNE
jgi:L-serine deaminase